MDSFASCRFAMYITRACYISRFSGPCIHFSVDYKNLSRHLMHTNVSKNIKPYYKAIYNTPLPSHSIISTAENPMCRVRAKHTGYRVNVHIVFIMIIIIILPRECVFFLLCSLSLSLTLVGIAAVVAAAVIVVVVVGVGGGGVILFLFHSFHIILLLRSEMGFWCGNAAMCTLESLCVLCVEL